MSHRRVIFIFVPLACVLSAASADEAGKKAFLDAQCERCHSVSSEDIAATVKSEKMRGPDLAKIGATRDAAWIEQFVKKEVQLDDKSHRAAWKGSDDDLLVIAKWLASLE